MDTFRNAQTPVNRRELGTLIFLCVVTLLTVFFKASEINVKQQQQYPGQALQLGGLRSATTTIVSGTSVEDTNGMSSSVWKNGGTSISVPETNHPGVPVIPHNIHELMMKSTPSIPAVYANLADVNESMSMAHKSTSQQSQQQPPQQEEQQQQEFTPQDHTEQVPFLWHIPRTGGATFSQIMGECLGLILASSSSTASVRHHPPSINDKDPDLHSFHDTFFSDSTELKIIRHLNSKYVNVDLGTTQGIQRAKFLKVLSRTASPTASEPLVQAVISPLIYDMSQILFEPTADGSVPQTRKKGRAFVMMRHPIDREISFFYHLKNATDHPLYREDLNIFEISDWLKSENFLDNVMVRSLIHQFDPAYQINVDDLLVAKEVLRRKCLVGLLEEKGLSWIRMEKYFREFWGSGSEAGGSHSSSSFRGKTALTKAGTECEEKMLYWGWEKRNSHRPFVEHDPYILQNQEEERSTWGLVDKVSYERVQIMNQWDILLYEYSKHLFWEQGKRLELDSVQSFTQTIHQKQEEEIISQDQPDRFLR